MIEAKDRKCVPVEERFLQVVTVDSNKNKFTINPVDGRCTLKFSNKTTEMSKQKILSFVDSFWKDEFPPVTLRGEICYVNGIYVLRLQSESKKFSVTVKSE